MLYRGQALTPVWDDPVIAIALGIVIGVLIGLAI